MKSVRPDRLRDLLVANAFAGNALPFEPGPFWHLSLGHWCNMFNSGVSGYIVAAWHAAPLLIARQRLLVPTNYETAEEESERAR